MQEYHRQKFGYLQAFERRHPTPFCPLDLKAFSDPCDMEGYDDRSVTDDMITEVYVEFGNKTRKAESDSYLRTKSGEHELDQHQTLTYQAL
jgi:hypothetical protein